MPGIDPNNIESLIMHRSSARLIDEVIEHNQQEILASTTVRHDSPCAIATNTATNTTTDTLTNTPNRGVAALICIEYMAQAVAAHASLIMGERQEGMLLGTRVLKLETATLAYGQRLHIRASSIFSTVSELGMYDCEVIDVVENRTLATAKIKAVRSTNLVRFLISDGQLAG